MEGEQRGVYLQKVDEYNEMKIGILTFHRADNFGALLQVYTLQKKIKVYYIEKSRTKEDFSYFMEGCQGKQNRSFSGSMAKVFKYRKGISSGCKKLNLYNEKFGY